MLAYLVLPSCQQVEQSNDCTLKFSATPSVDGGRGEGLPDNGLANVCGNEEGDTRTKTIALKG